MIDKIDNTIHDAIKTKNKKLALGVAAASILFAIIRLIITRFYIDPVLHFYNTENGSSALVFCDYIAAICILGVWISSMFIYKYKKDKYSYLAASDGFVQGTQTEVFSSSLAGFLLAFSSVLQISKLFQSDGYPFGTRVINYIKTDPFDFLIIFVSLLCSAYFFKTASLNFNQLNANSESTPPKNYPQLHIILSFMPVLWSFLNIFRSFFDMSKSVNSPVRIYELMCFLALSAYFVSESRMMVGRYKISRFFTFSYISLMLIALSALPNLVLSAFWILKTNNTQIIYAVQISFGFYIASRIYSQIRYSKFLIER